MFEDVLHAASDVRAGAVFPLLALDQCLILPDSVVHPPCELACVSVADYACSDSRPNRRERCETLGIMYAGGGNAVGADELVFGIDGDMFLVTRVDVFLGFLE